MIIIMIIDDNDYIIIIDDNVNNNIIDDMTKIITYDNDHSLVREFVNLLFAKIRKNSRIFHIFKIH